jgi:Polysaccharide lyase/Calx-beta domain
MTKMHVAINLLLLLALSLSLSGFRVARAATGTLQFSSATFTTNENGNTPTDTNEAIITVSRVGGSSGAVSVTYATSNGTATAGADYIDSTGSLFWADGDVGCRSFIVPLFNDTSYDLNETVSLTLKDSTGATLDTAVLTIRDHDLISNFTSPDPTYPQSGSPGTNVTIRNSPNVSFAGASAVKFGSRNANFTVLSNGYISATVPQGTFLQVPISVVTPSAMGYKANFTVTGTGAYTLDWENADDRLGLSASTDVPMPGAPPGWKVNYGSRPAGEEPAARAGVPPHAGARARNGQYAVRFELNRADYAYQLDQTPDDCSPRVAPPGGSARSELNGSPLGLLGSDSPSSTGATASIDSLGTDWWYGFSIYLPGAFDTSASGASEEWKTDASPEIVTQWHQLDPSSTSPSYGSPPLAIMTKNGQWVISMRQISWDNRVTASTDDIPVGAYQTGKWTDWVVHVKWSASSDGVLEIWKDGQKCNLLSSVHKNADGTPLDRGRGQNKFADGHGNFMNIGIYKWDWKDHPERSTADRRVLYHDELRIAAGPTNRYNDVAPRATWSVVDAAVGSDGQSRVLWEKSSGEIMLWTVNTSGVVTTQRYFGPFEGWHAIAIAANTISGTDNGTRILWQHSSGAITLWSVDAVGATNASPVYSSSGWSALNIAVGGDNKTRVLWKHSSGLVGLWVVDNVGPSAQVSYSPVYGQDAGWNVVDMTVGTDNTTHLLWKHSSEAIGLWRISAAGALSYSPVYRTSGWASRGVSVGADNKERILWQHSSGDIGLWMIDSSGAISYSPVYSAAAEWSAKGIAVGSDNNSRVLWQKVDGAMSLWTLDAAGGTINTYAYGPY